MLPAASSAQDKFYSGKIFHDRQYPSLSELPHVSLQDLVSIRPTPLHEPERDHFYTLFARHPTIRKQDLTKQSVEDFKQGWVDLWCGTRDNDSNPHDKKLPHCIEKHLKRDDNISPELREDIIRTCRRLKANASQRNRQRLRRQSNDPEDVEWHNQQREMRKVYNARRLRRGEYGKLRAKDFENMLRIHGISIRLPADHIELLTRKYRGDLGGLHSTTLAMKYYLRIRNEGDNSWQRAIDSRKAYNDALLKKELNKKDRLKKFDRSEYHLEAKGKLIRAAKWWLA